ncbi:hypothetical protein [Pseudoxanthomonas sp. JBR18]|uniref:hypothetical protein n=1 Tax=Pseudoxanthomonas sp. JBR18 TaxID=2969308 RepID=UPI0023053D3A|nr:hypothetical protein [Pseudoxanthomonas sp. JBR18]WCE04920.1 hypothetical protein PJ250_02725 [Pseudoxanthomonas sp. JBR18]
MPAIFGALLSLIGGLIGAAVGHSLAERKSRNDEWARMRLDAYSDFLRATSHLVAARRIGRTIDELTELGVLNDAKARICVCGDAEVLEALERFWLQGGTLEKEQEVLAYANLCRAMRSSLRKDRIPFETRLSDILFKVEPSSYSFRASRRNE